MYTVKRFFNIKYCSANKIFSSRLFFHLSVAFRHLRTRGHYGIQTADLTKVLRFSKFCSAVFGRSSSVTWKSYRQRGWRKSIATEKCIFFGMGTTAALLQISRSTPCSRQLLQRWVSATMTVGRIFWMNSWWHAVWSHCLLLLAHVSENVFNFRCLDHLETKCRRKIQ